MAKKQATKKAKPATTVKRKAKTPSLTYLFLSVNGTERKRKKFNTFEKAQKWAKENGYGLRFRTLSK